MKTKGNIRKGVNNNYKNSKKNIFYKTNPYGISLIVLVITIIVIIILATAIILTLSKNNPIEEANKARYESDRDSIQSIFTNTVVKVMAKNQGTIEVEEGIINSIKSGVSSTIGEVIYKIENPENSENKEGKIIFDNGTNTEVEYYTGRKLPIYKAGETIWSVNSEGVINLKVGEKTVGNNENEEDKKEESVVISKEEYDNLLYEIENVKGEIESIKKQSKNIERVNLMNKSFDIPLANRWDVKDFGDINLSDSIEKYKYLEINSEIKNDSNQKYYEKVDLISIDQLNQNNSNIANWENSSNFCLSIHETDVYYIVGWIKNDKTLHIGVAYAGDNRYTYTFRIKSIYGIR